MYLQLLITVIGSAALGALIVLIGTIIKTVASKRELEKGLPLLPEFSIWAGHINSFLLKEGMLYKVTEAHKRAGRKTLGWLYGYKKAAVSLDLDLIRRVVIDNQETDRIQMSMPLKEVEYDCLLSAGGEQFKRIRKAAAPALKQFKTPNVQREVESSINKLIKAIDSKLDEAKQTGGEIELNIDDYVHRFTLDLVFSCFYKQSNLIDFDTKVEPMSKLVDSGLEEMMWNPAVRVGVIFPVLRGVIDWLIMTFTEQGTWRKMIMEFVKRQTRLNFEARKYVEKQRKSGKQLIDEDNFLLEDGTKFSRNMIDHFIDQFHAGKLTKQEYFHTSWFLLGAADRTSSDAIITTLYQIATHPEVQDKLRRSILAEGLESEYLSWVINESIRLCPPAPIGCSRMTSRAYKCEDGVVPANTLVVSPVYTIHRMPEYWGQDADEFRPERFAKAKDFHPLQFIPFGAGQRTCPGREFAMHEMKKLFCALMTRYKFSCEPMELTYNSPWFIFMIPSQHVHVRITRV